MEQDDEVLFATEDWQEGSPDSDLEELGEGQDAGVAAVERPPPSCDAVANVGSFVFLIFGPFAFGELRLNCTNFLTEFERSRRRWLSTILEEHKPCIFVVTLLTG